MRLGAAGSVLLFCFCSVHPTGDAAAGDRACTVNECFYARDVRDFDVIDKSTLIVYVGPQRCAFRVELRGTFCDLTYAPELIFTDPHDLPQGERDPRTQGPATAGDISFAPGGIATRNIQSLGRNRNLRVCDNDLRLQVSGGSFTESTIENPLDPASEGPAQRGGRFLTSKTDCQIASVGSITDDQVMEIYVKHRVSPPPPPMGSGDLQMGKQSVVEEPTSAAGQARDPK
jgi:hypothetical protein